MVSAETILGIVGGFTVGVLSRSASQIISYEYKKWDQQRTQKSNEQEQWYESTIQLANQIQDAKREWEDSNIPKLKQDQRKFSRIADQLSSHHVEGEQLEVNKEILDLIDQTEEDCREVTRPNVSMGAVGISSEITTADESAQQLEQAAKEKI